MRSCTEFTFVVGVTLALCATLGCSNRALVAKAVSTATYAQASYEHKCIGTGHPDPNCGPCQTQLNLADWQTKVAIKNRDMGYLPPKEIADLDQLIKDLEVCP